MLNSVTLADHLGLVQTRCADLLTPRDAELKTTNLKHFPMLNDLKAPY